MVLLLYHRPLRVSSQWDVLGSSPSARTSKPSPHLRMVENKKALGVGTAVAQQIGHRRKAPPSKSTQPFAACQRARCPAPCATPPTPRPSARQRCPSTAEAPTLAVGYDNGSVGVWDSLSRSVVTIVDEVHPGEIVSVCWARRGRHNVSAGADGTVSRISPALTEEGGVVCYLGTICRSGVVAERQRRRIVD